MSRAVVSTKYQVVIPKGVRKDIGLKTGQVVEVIGRRGVITLVLDQPLFQLRGYLKGMKKQGLRAKRQR